MSPRRRRSLASLLSESALAQSQVEREKIRAERDANNVRSGVDALRSLVPGVAGIYADTVKRDDDKKEKLRLEGREDEALLKKLAREDKLNEIRQKREEAAAAAKAEAEKAEREQKIKIDETKLIQAAVADDAVTVDRQRDDARAAREHEEKLLLEHEKIAAKSKGGTKKPTEADDLKLRLLKAQAEKAEADAKKKADAGSKGKPMSADDINALTGQRSAIKNLEDLKGLAENVDQGVFSAASRAMPSWLSSLKSDERVAFEKANDRAIQNVAKALEGGKLTDQDAERYTKMLMDASNSKAAYMEALARVTAEVKSRQGAYEANLGESGYLVPGANADAKRARLEELRRKALQ